MSSYLPNLFNLASGCVQSIPRRICPIHNPTNLPSLLIKLLVHGLSHHLQPHQPRRDLVQIIINLLLSSIPLNALRSGIDTAAGAGVILGADRVHPFLPCLTEALNFTLVARATFCHGLLCSFLALLGLFATERRQEEVSVQGLEVVCFRIRHFDMLFCGLEATVDFVELF